jgi:hypothetical protein
MPTMDQVAWATCNVSVPGGSERFARGDLLPEPGSDAERAERSTLRTIGAIRTVEVVYTPEELADQARERGQATAAREAALDVDPSLPLADQVPGTVEPGRPTLMEPSGAPVVIGDEELRAEHQAAADEAGRRRAEEEQNAPPPATASKADWADFAVRVRGADRAEAEKLNRDELRRKYRDPEQPAQAGAEPGAAKAPGAKAQGDVASGVHQPASPAKAGQPPK